MSKEKRAAKKAETARRKAVMKGKTDLVKERLITGIQGAPKQDHPEPDVKIEKK